MKPAAGTIVVWTAQATEKVRNLGLGPHLEDIQRTVEKFDFRPTTTPEFGYGEYVDRNGRQWHVLTIPIEFEEIPTFEEDWDAPGPPGEIVMYCTQRLQSDQCSDPSVRGYVVKICRPSELLGR